MTTVTMTLVTNVVRAIRDEHKAAQRDHISAVQHAIKCGRLLIEAKAGQQHGDWLEWITHNFDFSQRTAQGYMRLARLDGEKAQRVAVLSLRQALKDIGEQFGRKQQRLERQVDDDLRTHAHEGVAVRVEDPDHRPAVLAGSVVPRPRKAKDVETVVDQATVAIAKWFSSIADSDRSRLAKAIKDVVEEYEVAA